MKKVWRIFLFILNLLNWWFFKIPSRFSFLAMVGNFLIIYWFQDGRPIRLLERDLRSMGDFVYFSFWIGFGLPMFWGFICCWSGSKMASAGFRKSNSSTLDKAIEYRDQKISNKTPQEAFEIMKNTASLDQMKANEGNPTFDKAVQGLNAQFGNKTPQEIFNKLSSKD